MPKVLAFEIDKVERRENENHFETEGNVHNMGVASRRVGQKSGLAQSGSIQRGGHRGNERRGGKPLESWGTIP